MVTGSPQCYRNRSTQSRRCRLRMPKPFRQGIVFGLLILAIESPQLASEPVLEKPAVELGEQAAALLNAARRGHADEVTQLLASKVDVNSATRYGVTALSLACDHGHEGVVEVLLAAGADPNTKDRFYQAGPLTWAVMRKRSGIVRRLIEAGVKDIDSALTSTVAIGDENTTQVILESKRVSAEGITAAAMLAHTANAENLLKLIESAMDDSTRTLVAQRWMEELARRKLTAYVGTYKSESGETRIVSTSAMHLEIQVSRNEKPVPLEPLDDGRQYKAGDSRVSFDVEGDKVVGLRVQTGDRELKLARVMTDSEESMASGAAIVADESMPRLAITADYPLSSDDWPSFRGLMARGIGGIAALAKDWNAESGLNIAWKTAVPGCGTSSPISWGTRVYLTTADCEADKSGFRTGLYGDVDSVDQNGECRYLLLCYDLASGKLLWDREVARGVPKVKRHAKSSHANPTPATDGTSVVAFFGDYGVYCYDMEGNLRWHRDLGPLDSGWFYDRTYQWGFGSSPFLFEDMVIVQCDVQDESFIAALDLATGVTRWQTRRDEIPTWGSPVAFMASDGTPMVVVSGTKCAAAYQARTGEQLWKLGGFSEIAVPTPQITPDMLLLTTGYAPVQPIVALAHSARGELELPAMNTGSPPFYWSHLRGGPYMSTPLIFDQRLYILQLNGVLSVYDLATGRQVHRQRIADGASNAFTASPVASGGYLYCTSEDGKTTVITLDEKCAIRSRNELREAVLATPAISHGKLLIRGEKHLFAIQEP